MSLLSLPAHSASSPALAPSLPLINLCGEYRDSVHRVVMQFVCVYLSIRVGACLSDKVLPRGSVMRDRDIDTARTNQPSFPPPSCLAAAPWRRAPGAQCIACMLAHAHKQLNTAPFPARRGKRCVRNTDFAS